MKKFLKISGIVLLLLVVSLVAAPFLFKGKIVEAVKNEANKNLNAKVNFSEDIGISIFKSFPQLTLSLKEVSIAGIDTFSGDTLAWLPSVSVSLDIMSVIKGDKMEIRKIVLDQPSIHLLVLENGKANWDITKPDSTATDTAASTFKLGLEKLEINKGNLVYDDRSIPFFTSLKSFDHTMKGDFTLDRFVMETSTKAEELTLGYDGVNYIYKVGADIKANLDMDMKEMKFTFSENDVLLNQLHLGGEGFVDLNENDMDFDLAFRSKKTDFKTILSMVPGIYSKSFDKAKASGKLDFSAYLKGKMTEEKMPGFGLNLNIDNGFFQYPDLPKSLKNIFLNLKIDNKTGYPDNTVVDLSRFDANIAGEAVHATLLMKTPVSNPYAELDLRGNINLGEFRNFIPLEKTTEISGLIKSDLSFKGHISDIETKALDRVQASGTIAAERFHFKDPEMLSQGTDLNARLSFTPMVQKLEQCEGKVGMSDFKINGQIENLFGYMMKDELLKGNFTFFSDYFNANEFLTDEDVKKEPSSTDSLPLQAFEVPAGIDMVLGSRINTLVYDNLKLTDVAGNVILRESKLLFEKLGLNMLQGSLSLNGEYDSKNPKFPFSDVDFDIKSLDIIETFNSFDMVQKLMPVAKYTHGHFNADIHLSNNFNQDLSVAYPTVSGEIKMGITEAAVKGLPVLNAIAEKLKLDKLKDLNMKNLNFKMNIQDGKVVLDSMLLPLWTGAKAKISGYTALDQSISYIAKLSIPRKDFGEANTALNGLTEQARKKGLNIKLSEMVDIDVLISGFFNKPDIKVSLHDAKNSLIGGVKDQLQDEAEKRKQAAEEEARRRVEAARKKTQDSLNRLKQQAIDKVAAERKAAEEKLAEEKRKAEEAAEKAKQEAARKLEEEKKKALDRLKKGIGK